MSRVLHTSNLICIENTDAGSMIAVCFEYVYIKNVWQKSQALLT